MKTLSGRSPETVKAYRKDLDYFLSFLDERLGRPWKPGDSLSTSLVRAYQNRLRTDKLSTASIARHNSAVRSFLGYLYTEGYTVEDSADLFLSPKKGRSLPGFISAKQMESILDSMPEEGFLPLRNGALLELLYSTGMRVSELTSLSRSDYRKGNGTMRIIGKGNRERVVFVNERASRRLDKICSSAGYEGSR